MKPELNKNLSANIFSIPAETSIAVGEREEKRREEKRREEKRRDNLLTIQASPFAYKQNNTFIYNNDCTVSPCWINPANMNLSKSINIPRGKYFTETDTLFNKLLPFEAANRLIGFLYQSFATSSKINALGSIPFAKYLKIAAKRTVPSLKGGANNQTGMIPDLTGAIPSLKGMTPVLTGGAPSLKGMPPTSTGTTSALMGATPSLAGMIPLLKNHCSVQNVCDSLKLRNDSRFNGNGLSRGGNETDFTMNYKFSQQNKSNYSPRRIPVDY